MFGPKREEVARGRRRLHNEEHVARMGEMRKAYKILVEKHEGKTPLGRPSRRWKNNINMNIMEIGWDRVNWTRLTQDRDQWWDVVNTVMEFHTRRGI
jgi:hypothetical protein